MPLTRDEADKLVQMMHDAIFSFIQQPQPETTATPAAPAGGLIMKFPAHLREILTFATEGNQIVVKPTKYLGKETFAELSQIVKGLGGRYVSAGKNSHFEVPK